MFLSDCEIKALDPLFEMVENLKDIQQLKHHHPEGDAFVHTLQVLYCAFKETDDFELVIAAMVHDVGKAVDSLRHESIGESMLKDYVSPKVLFLVKNHLRVRFMIDGIMKEHQKVKDLLNHPWLPQLIHLVRLDRMGRNPNKKIVYDKQDIILKLDKIAEKHFRPKPDTKNFDKVICPMCDWPILIKKRKEIIIDSNNND